MKRCILLMQVLLLSCVLIFSGCQKKTTEPTASDVAVAGIYYISEDGADLVSEQISIPNESRKGQLKYLLEQLIAPQDGKRSPLNDGTKLNGVSIQNDIAVVDFSAAFYGDDKVRNTLGPAAVAQTLCSLDYISGVQILVDGEELRGSDGKPMGIIRENEVVLDEAKPTAVPKTTVVLYFGDENAEKLVQERRNVEIQSGDTVEKVVIEELFKGPTEGGSLETIPDGTRLLSVETKDKVCYVNFSKEFVDKHSGGMSAEQLTIYSVVNSLTELGTIEQVQFLIEGEKREEYIHSIFNEPISRDESLIE